MTFFLCLAAALCAENIPVMLLLVVAALILTIKQEKATPGAATPRAAKRKQPSTQTKLFRPHCTGAGEGSQV